MCDKSDPTETCCSIFWGPVLTVEKQNSSAYRSKSCIRAFPPDELFFQNFNNKENSNNCFTSPMCNTDVVRSGVSTVDLCSRPR